MDIRKDFRKSKLSNKTKQFKTSTFFKIVDEFMKDHRDVLKELAKR